MSKFLVKDLNELVQANVISQAVSDDIEAYYDAKKETAPNRFPIVVNILGALLVSLGIILVVAHNWDALNRMARTVFAFLPLLIGQALCAYTLLKRRQNTGWRETSAVLLFFAIGTSISLISQTYHINGTMSGFLLTWMLLAIPIVYIMPSSVTALLYIGGITWYACVMGYFNDGPDQKPYYYLLLLALIIPHYYFYYKTNSKSNFLYVLNWMLVLSLTIVLGAFNVSYYDVADWGFTAYLALFCVFYLWGRSLRFENTRLFANPFLVIGALGILSILFWFSFDDVWQISYGYGYPNNSRPSGYLSPLFYVSILLLLVAGFLMMSDYKRIKKLIFDPAGFSGFLVFLLLLVLRDAPNVGVFLINAWILFVAIFFIRKGALFDHLGILNFGLLIIAILATCRFFDGQIPFIWRGLFFLLTGVGFFVANYWLVKKRKHCKTNNV